MTARSLWTECFDTPDTPLTVTTGLIVITGDCPVLLLPGMTWPGTDALNYALGMLILPGHLRAAGGTSTRPPTTEELAAAPAQLAAQVIRTLPATIAALHLQELTGASPQRPADAALILGCSSETASRVMVHGSKTASLAKSSPVRPARPAQPRTKSTRTLLKHRILDALADGPLPMRGILDALTCDGHTVPTAGVLSVTLAQLKRENVLTGRRDRARTQGYVWSAA